MNTDEIHARAEAANPNWVDHHNQWQAQYKKDVTALLDALEAKERENKALRNELCSRCGQYREAHNGACNGCKWRADNGTD